MTEHWLLYTSDREHGGTVILGIFSSEEDSWSHYRKVHPDKNDRYWNVPFVECWENEKKVEET